MGNRHTAVAVLSLSFITVAASAGPVFRPPMLVLCGLHGDAWIEGLAGTSLKEIKIESYNGALVPPAYESFADRGYEPSMLLANTPSLLWDMSYSPSIPPVVGNYDLGFVYNRTADGPGLDDSRWTFHYDNGSGLQAGEVAFWIPEPASLSLLGLGALALLRRRRK